MEMHNPHRERKKNSNTHTHAHTIHSNLMSFRVIVIMVFCLYVRAHVFFRQPILPFDVIKAHTHIVWAFVYIDCFTEFARKISHSIFYAATHLTGNNNNTVPFIKFGISNVTFVRCVDCFLSSLTVMGKKQRNSEREKLNSRIYE